MWFLTFSVWLISLRMIISKVHPCHCHLQHFLKRFLSLSQYLRRISFLTLSWHPRSSLVSHALGFLSLSLFFAFLFLSFSAVGASLQWKWSLSRNSGTSCYFITFFSKIKFKTDSGIKDILAVEGEKYFNFVGPVAEVSTVSWNLGFEKSLFILTKILIMCSFWLIWLFDNKILVSILIQYFHLC